MWWLDADGSPTVVDSDRQREPYWSFRQFPSGGYIFLGRRRIGLADCPVIPAVAMNVPMSATWRKHAACRGIDPDVFYPVSDEESDEAKSICDQCVVREACLEHALANREREGVWGGTTERERRRIHRQRRKSA